MYDFEAIKAEAAANFVDWGVVPNNVEFWQEVYRLIHQATGR